MSVYDEQPSPAAGLLQLARMDAGLTQAELARRAGVPASMVSAYERDVRQPTMATLLRLLKAAGYELRMHLAPYDDHDDALARERAAWPKARLEAWENYQRCRITEGQRILDDHERAHRPKRRAG